MTEPPTGRALTVAFVDLVRFTSLTDVHGDVAGADAAAALVEVTHAALGPGAALVKTAGDGVLVTADAPAGGLDVAIEVIERLHAAGTGLDARGGLAHGPVIERAGDVFGSTVNLAARLASLASPGSLAFTRPVAVAAARRDFAVEPLGPTEVSGFADPIEVFRADPCDHDEPWIRDPVCGMRVRADLALVRHLDGIDVGFCSSRCAALYENRGTRHE